MKINRLFFTQGFVGQQIDLTKYSKPYWQPMKRTKRWNTASKWRRVCHQAGQLILYMLKPCEVNIRIKLGDCLSSKADLKYGVPQGSVLDPLLFSLYTTLLSCMICGHAIPPAIHSCAPLYLEQPATVDPFSQFICCIQEIPEDTSLWLGLSLLYTRSPDSPLMPQNCLIDFPVKYRFSCRATEPAFTGDIGTIEMDWFIDWLIEMNLCLQSPGPSCNSTEWIHAPWKPSFTSVRHKDGRCGSRYLLSCAFCLLLFSLLQGQAKNRN